MIAQSSKNGFIKKRPNDISTRLLVGGLLIALALAFVVAVALIIN
jgi:hypothetical protein